MSRQKNILSQIDKNGFGIEIGPSHNPIAPKKAGYKVDIIDHISKEKLVEKYNHNNLNISNIEDVDFIWNGESYSELTGKRNYYDWIIASHLIEHTPDLIAFLNDCSAVLNDAGVLALVIPDKRFCFDRFRPITSLSQIVDSHYSKNKIHTPGTIAEYFLNVVSKSGTIAWQEGVTGKYEFCHTLSDAIVPMKAALETGAYVDVHAWCFVPSSFRLLIEDLFALGLIDLREVKFAQTSVNEFYVILSRNGKGPDLSRKEIVDDIEIELIEGSICDYPKYGILPKVAEESESSGSLPEALREKLPETFKEKLMFLAEGTKFHGPLKTLAKYTRPIRSLF